MADAVEILEMLKSINIREVCIETAEEGEEQMRDAMEDQLSRGERADGTDIAPPYTFFTIMEKEKKSGLASVTDVVTLFDTGAHYEGLFADVQGMDILFGSKDKKSDALQSKYGKIYGLNDESREAVIEDFIEPRFQSKIERLTGLSFK